MTKRDSKGKFAKAGRKIAIWGYAEESRDGVFQLPEQWEVWGINMAHHFLANGMLRAKVTNWFQLHPQDWNGSGKGATGYWGRPIEHLKFLEQFEGTVWMQYPDDPMAQTITNRKRYPTKEIADAAGRDYLTSTFSYQLALIWYQHAIENNPVSEVAIYGVNLSATEEYAHQRPAVEYWIGRLEGAGVAVTIPESSSIMKGTLYARQIAKNPADELAKHANGRLNHWRDRYNTAKSDALVAQAIRGEIGYWTRFLEALFTPVADKIPEDVSLHLRTEMQNKLQSRFNEFGKLEQKSFADLNGATAMVKDNFHWMTMMGGIDLRAYHVDEYRSPSSGLFGEFAMPEIKAI